MGGAGEVWDRVVMASFSRTTKDLELKRPSKAPTQPRGSPTTWMQKVRAVIFFF